MTKQKNLLQVFILSIFLSIAFSCGEKKTETKNDKPIENSNPSPITTTESSTSYENTQPSAYEMMDEEMYETNNTAQLIEYIVYKDTIYTQEVLEKILLDVYDKNKNKDVFDNFDSPTVFGVNIYTSREKAKNDKGSWIGTLTKVPNDSKPRLSYNDLKIKSLQGLNDNKKSEDEIAYENLTKYLQERNIELCSFYQQLRDMELNCIHEADAKFPDYDYPEHVNYADKRMKEEREKLITKHNLVDSIFVRISMFGMAYCK